MRRLRFSLKAILAVTAIVAVSCYSYLEYQKHLERMRLRKIRDGFLRWAESTDRSDKKIHSYFHLDSAADLSIVTNPGTRKAFLVANAPMVFQPGQNPDLLFSPRVSGTDQNRFYVLPSKKWVDSPNEVIAEWDAWHRVNY